MKIKLLLLCHLIVFSLNACAQKATSSNPVSKMGWIVGSWQGTYKDKPFYESWKKKNDSVLVNLTIEVTKTDTVIKENGVMMAGGKGTVYLGSTAQWKLTAVTDTSIVLSNDTLKYANKITWWHSKDDHWLTVIENPKDVIKYDLVRVAWLDKYVDNFMAKMTKSGK